MKATFQTSITLSKDEHDIVLKLREHDFTLIDIFREGIKVAQRIVELKKTEKVE